MTTATFYAGTADGYLSSRDDDYSLARAGTGALLSFNTTATEGYVGQAADGNPGFLYQCTEGFLSFDTSSLPDDAVILSVTLSLYGDTDSSTTDFTINARAHDWGAEITGADWVAGASLPAKTLLATFATSGWSVAGYNDFTSEAAFLTAINKNGTTYIILSSSRHEGNNTPSGDEYVLWETANNSGTSKDPKLVVEYTQFTGTIAASLQPLTAALTGGHEAYGPIAVSLQPLTAVLTGWHEETGAIAATLQPLTAALGGRNYFPEIEGVPRPATSKVARSGAGTTRGMSGVLVRVNAPWDDGIGWDEGLWDYNQRAQGSGKGTSR